MEAYCFIGEINCNIYTHKEVVKILMDLLHLYSCLSGTVYRVEQYVMIKKTKCCQHISFSFDSAAIITFYCVQNSFTDVSISTKLH